MMKLLNHTNTKSSTVWGYMVGDYISASHSAGKAVPFFPVATALETGTHQAVTRVVVVEV